MTKISLVLVLLYPLLMNAQPVIESSLFSKNLSEDRKILISLPPYYSLKKDSFQVIYLLDADNRSLFDLTVASKRFLEANAVDLSDFNTPPAIVVGILQKERSGDFNKNGPLLLKFLTDELMPYIDASYRTQPYHILFGHSLAGGFALRAFLQRPDLFNAVITASPALTEKNIAGVEAAIDSLFSASRYTDRAWFLSTSHLRNDNTEEQFRPFAEAIKNFMAGRHYPNFRFHCLELDALGHAKTPYLTIPEGFRFVYTPDLWQMPQDWMDQVFAGKMPVDTALANYQKLIRHRFGITMPTGKWVSVQAAQLINQNKPLAAKNILVAALAADPTDLDLYDQLIDLLEQTGGKEAALYKDKLDTIRKKMQQSR